MRQSLAVVLVFALALCACNRKDTHAAAPTTPATKQPDRYVPPAKPVQPPAPAPSVPSVPSTNATDARIAADVARAILDSADLSMNAHNVKVTCADAVVTLRGKVDNDAERERVAALATGIAGVTRVDNQLEIETPR